MTKNDCPYLLFASYRTGGYANTVHKSIKDIVEVIKNYIELEEDEGYEVNWQDGDIEELGKYIEEKLKGPYDKDTMIAMTDGTWFLVTKAYETYETKEIYEVRVPCEEIRKVECDNIKYFETKEEAEEFISYIKENGLIGIDFDEVEDIEVIEVYDQDYRTNEAVMQKNTLYQKVGEKR